MTEFSTSLDDGQLLVASASWEIRVRVGPGSAVECVGDGQSIDGGGRQTLEAGTDGSELS